MPALIQAQESPDTRWSALRVKSRCEKVTAAILHNKGYQEFPPLSRSRRRWSDRTKQPDLPLFPGYVFCRFDPHDRLHVLTTPGLVHIVGIAGIPVPVDDREIDAVHAIIKSGLAAEPWPVVKVGNIVRIDHGSLEGLEGILIEIKKRHRPVVSVTLLQRSVAVEIDRDWVSLVRSTHRPGPPATALRTASVVSAQFPLPQRAFYEPTAFCFEENFGWRSASHKTA